MKTVHIIFNAHLDPIWLWPWQAGLDEAINTCRSACDRLDKHADIIFTRNEAWVYQQIEKTDGKLFERIRAHIAAKRWEVVGGWWIQPDCNAPSGFAMEKQIALGKKYFTEKFGVFPKIGYNVDSFGHAATLPGLMHAAGQDKYIFMRPQEHEKELPARLFRWRGYEGGPEVATFRIAGAYQQYISGGHLQDSLSHLPEGIEHTMCFFGVGDHGGGPTEAMIAWLRQEKEKRKNEYKIEFSSPSRFFAAIEKDVPKLPLVTGELQHHAIGCYSVYRPIKVGVRRAEHLMKQADVVAGTVAHIPAAAPLTARIEEAWQRVAFHQFHDTMGGTCIPSAYVAVLDQLSAACTVGDEVLQYGLRLRIGELPDDKLHRIVLMNASDSPWNGYVEVEPWMDWDGWKDDFRLVDEKGEQISSQNMQSEASINGVPRLIFKADIPAGGLRVVKIERGNRKAETSRVVVEPERIINDVGAAAKTGWEIQLRGLPGGGSLCPRLDLIPDPSDTWSHGFEFLNQGPIISPVWDAPVVLDRGPVLAAMIQQGKISDSLLRAEWRVYAGEPFVELKLQVHWRERFKLLKMSIPLGNGGEKWGGMENRLEGIMGGRFVRKNNGKELPMRDWMLLDSGAGEGRLGIACPDVYGADGMNERVRLTLLRSPLMAQHDPFRNSAPRAIHSDQGVHEFRFRFFAGDVTAELLEHHATMMQRPLVAAETTRGMPTATRKFA